MQAALAVTPAEARPGQSLTVTLTNTGAHCLHTGIGVWWQVDRDGAWVDAGFSQAGPAAIRLLPPGEQFVERVVVPQDATPGRYRIVKWIDGGGPRTGVAAELAVTS